MIKNHLSGGVCAGIHNNTSMNRRFIMAIGCVVVAGALAGCAHSRTSQPNGINVNDLQLKQVPIAKTGMLIRKPVADVFEAFINPDITTKFWFTRSSGKLEAGKHVQWDWEMYGISIPVTVKSIEPRKRIVIEWAGYGRPTTVEWVFTDLKDGTTFVSITNSGFAGDGDELVKQATDSTQGFSLVLAGLKALLEHNIQLNLVADRFPKGIEDH